MAVGLISSANLPTDLAAKSFSAMLTRLQPNGTAKLFALTSLLKDETASAIEHGYYTKTMEFQSAKINNGAGYTTSDTTFTVDAYTNLVAGDMLRNERTSEIVIVNTTPSATSITVTRAIGTTAAAAILDNDDFYHIGNAFEQGSVRPQAVALVAVRYINYTQIFRNSWAVTKTLAALPLIAGDGAVAESKRDCANFHALSIEKALFFGQKYQGTRNGMPFQTMEGVIARIVTAASGNITTLGSTTNWTQLEAALDPMLQTVTDASSGNIRTMFVGGVARRVIHAIAQKNSSYDITGTETSWGLQIDQVRTPRGIFEMIEHPLFNAYGSAATWAKMAVVMDLNAFSIAYLRRTEELNYNDNGTPVDNGIDARGGTLTTELTCCIKNPAAFGILYNFTAGAAG